MVSVWLGLVYDNLSIWWLLVVSWCCRFFISIWLCVMLIEWCNSNIDFMVVGRVCFFVFGLDCFVGVMVVWFVCLWKKVFWLICELIRLWVFRFCSVCCISIWEVLKWCINLWIVGRWLFGWVLWVSWLRYCFRLSVLFCMLI